MSLWMVVILVPNVLKDATIKFFLTASVEERAKEDFRNKNKR